MRKKLLTFPDEFWLRLFVVFVAFAGAMLGKKIIPIPFALDPSLTMSIYAVFALIGWFIFKRVVNDTFWTYLIVQLIFFFILVNEVIVKFIHISFKPEPLVFGLALVAGSYYLIKNFKFIWQFAEIKFLAIFLIINIIYYFFHYSTFNVGLEGLAYGDGSGVASADSKKIIFLSSICAFLGSIIALSVFKNVDSKEKIHNIIVKLSFIFTIFLGILVPFLLLLGPNEFKGGGFQISAPIYLGFLLTFKYYLDNFHESSSKYNTCLILLITAYFVFSTLAGNKTSLIAFLFSISIFLFVNLKEGFKFKTFLFLKKGRLRLVIVPLFIVIITGLAIKFGLIDIIGEKVGKAITGVGDAGINSFYIRKSNWKYFTDYWTSHLDFLTTIFGFGLAKSREVIFYISASQYSPIYKVQTTHNQYMEMFFDYGLMAIFYFIPLIIVFFKSVVQILNPRTPKEIKLFSNFSFILIIFYFVYHLTDGLRVPVALAFFSAIMFCEGLKFSMQKAYKASQGKLI
ncbi:MAG TPA: hypothetical protein P5556_02675 [Candidatus Gastranaerophilales bacterium]|nr:hypothetical protein [Candidatus Gastranaerophilales bacterium]